MTAQREAFEAWAWHLNLGMAQFKGEYTVLETSITWQAWQAAQAAMLTAKPVAWANRAELRDMPFAVVVQKFQTETSDLPLYTKETP